MLRRTGCSFALLCCCSAGATQTCAKQGNGPDGYTLRLPVDEVVLTFHAEDSNGVSINDLKAGDIRVWDNGAVPRRVVAFDALVNRPLRVGILLETSESTERDSQKNKSIAEKFFGQIFRQKTDGAFVSEFGYASELVEPWTGNVLLLRRGVESAKAKATTPGGTALFNAVFGACSSSFGKVDPTATGNVLLLFSDGAARSVSGRLSLVRRRAWGGMGV